MENRFEWPLNANQACRNLRDGRIGIDYVEDDVDIQLEREFEMLKKGSVIYNNCLKSPLPLIAITAAAENNPPTKYNSMS